MFIYFIQNSHFTDDYGYVARFHRVYNDYKDAKEFINNYLEELKEDTSGKVKVNYESEDRSSSKTYYIISYSFDGFDNKTIKERFTITLEHLY
jgi:lysyl-tRNA synthetase class II